MAKLMKVARSAEPPDGYRLATVRDAREHVQTIEQNDLLENWDTVRLEDGWMGGLGYAFPVQQCFRPDLQYMLVINAHTSTPGDTQEIESEQGRKAALLFYCEDGNYREAHRLLSISDESDHVAIDQSGSRSRLMSANTNLASKAHDKYERSALHIAAFHGHSQICRSLIDVMKVDVRDKANQTPLHSAVSGSQNALVIDTLLYGSSIQKREILESRDKFGRTPLHLAAAKGSVAVVQKLINRSESPNIYVQKAGFMGQTALHEAARRGHVETVKKLLQLGAQPLAERDSDGKTALHFAVHIENEEIALNICKLLLEKCTSAGEKSLLLWADAAGIGTAEETARSPAVKRLLSEEKKNTLAVPNLLKTAACLGNIDMTRELLNRGADIRDIHSSHWINKLSREDQANVRNVLKEINPIRVQGSDQPSLDDNLGRKVFAEGLATLLLNPYTGTPITVGISGEWGMGKSSLMMQVEVLLLKMASLLAFPNLCQAEAQSFPGAKKVKLSTRGYMEYTRIAQAVKLLILNEVIDQQDDEEEALENPLAYFLNDYRPQYHAIYKSLALLDRSEMLESTNDKWNGTTGNRSLGIVPAILTVRYNAWQYRNESEAWAGLAVEITREMENTMTMAQWLGTCWRYSWSRQRRSIFTNMIIPCFFIAILSVWVAVVGWLLLRTSNNNRFETFQYGFIPLSVLVIVWVVVTSMMSVIKPISDQMIGYMQIPDHSGKLGYHQKVISDINFLKREVTTKPSPFWRVISGQWCGNWFGSYHDCVGDSLVPKITPPRDNLRIIVFVDDLDRCHENVILQVLSAINLVLAACEINVILGMDKTMIERAIGSRFRNSNQNVEDLADKFLRKIIQLQVDLPDLSDAELKIFLEGQLGVPEKPPEQTHTTDEVLMPHLRTREWSPDLRLKMPSPKGHDELHCCPNIFNCSPSFMKSIGEFRSNTPTTLPISGEMLIIMSYGEGERKAFYFLRRLATGNRKFPREWKRLLNYHSLAWNILSKSPAVTNLTGWQVQLIVWIFVCWQWKDQMNALIVSWPKYVVSNTEFKEKEIPLSDGVQTGSIHCMESSSEIEGPSLLDIVEYYIESRWPLQRNNVGTADQANEEEDDLPRMDETHSERIGSRRRKGRSRRLRGSTINRSAGEEDEAIKVEREIWKKLREVLNRYDVSMKGIQAFQRFRYYCKPGYLSWPTNHYKNHL